MNVVHRDKRFNFKCPKVKRGLLIKDSSTGIRGSRPLSTIKAFTTANSVNRHTNAPRYRFQSLMGPPLEPPKSSKRKYANNSTSLSKPDSLSSGRLKAGRILANDSLADTSNEFGSPRNKPTALRYISNSSRGGTFSARSTNTSMVDPSTILAISEGRGMARGEIGMAAIDLVRPHLTLCQFSDTLLYTHTLTKINYFNPVEIIVPHTFCEGAQPNQLYQLIKDQYPTINLSTVQRRHFNDAAGRQQIQTLCAPVYSAVYLQVIHKFYALTAAAAVLKYVEYIQCIVFARESLKIEYHSSENTMIIDVGTATQLELVQPLLPSAGATCCLLGVLGPTYTAGGIRALRATILQPSCDKHFIETRLDCVQDLIENDSGLMAGLQDVLKKLAEIDKILLLCIETPAQNVTKLGEAQLNQTLILKTTMELVPSLVEALAGAESGRLRKIKMDLENPHYKEINDRIRTKIQDDAHLEKGTMGSLQRCFAVKPEINGLLDVARRTYSELIEDIQKIVEQLAETYDLSLKLNQTVMKGFHVVLYVGAKNRKSFKVEELPPIFIHVQNNGASVTMTTEDLIILDQQAKESLNEIQKMSNIVISALLKDLRPFMSTLYTLCENVAELDILLALAQASSIEAYVRPEFGDYLCIRNSVHPLLDFNSHVTPVPNDIFATPEHNFTIITGPNMGGKSIYIKQIALMQIMAQVGCFLPTTRGTLRLCDRLFSRMGFNDSVELNASTYVLEMKEMQHILKNLTPTSLVIIDELCRGTSDEEGASMAWAICEELLMSDAFVFFTTHFMYLTRLQELYFNVINLHTTVKEVTHEEDDTKRLVYDHKIDVGTTTVENYGLALAATTNLPKDVVDCARELAKFITSNSKPQTSIRTPIESEDSLLYQLNAEIKNETRKNEGATDKIKVLISNFKIAYPEIIENLKTIRNNDSNQSVCTTSSTNNARIRDVSVNVHNITTSSNGPSIQYKPINKVGTVVLEDLDDTTATKHINYASVKSINELFNTVIDNNMDYEDQTNDNKSDSDQSKSANVSGTENLLPNTTHIDNTDNMDYEDENINMDYHHEDETNNNKSESDKSKSANVSGTEKLLSNTTTKNLYDNADIVMELDNCTKSDDYNKTISNQQLEISNKTYSSTAKDNNFDSDSDSDIAEALTQILVDCDVHCDATKNVYDKSIQNISGEISSDTNSYISFTDYILMTETIDVINSDINNFEDIILPPPPGFRDE